MQLKLSDLESGTDTKKEKWITGRDFLDPVRARIMNTEMVKTAAGTMQKCLVCNSSLHPRTLVPAWAIDFQNSIEMLPTDADVMLVPDGRKIRIQNA